MFPQCLPNGLCAGRGRSGIIYSDFIYHASFAEYTADDAAEKEE